MKKLMLGGGKPKNLISNSKLHQYMILKSLIFSLLFLGNKNSISANYWLFLNIQMQHKLALILTILFLLHLTTSGDLGNHHATHTI